MPASASEGEVEPGNSVKTGGEAEQDQAGDAVLADTETTMTDTDIKAYLLLPLIYVQNSTMMRMSQAASSTAQHALQRLFSS